MRHLLLLFLVACSSTSTGEGSSSKPDASKPDPPTDTGSRASETGGDGGDSSNSGSSSSNTDTSGKDPPSSDGSAGGAVGGGAGTQEEAAGDSCNEIFTCVGQCADDACSNDCYAKGSADGKQAIDTLVACLDTNACTDATCASTYCKEQIDACINDVTVKPDSGQPVTHGSVDPSLVGDWMGTSISYHFSADGSYFMVGLLVSSGSCIAFDHIDFTDKGVARTQGNVLTTTATTTKQVTTDCAGNQTSKTRPGDTNQFTWSVSGSTLTLVGDTGAIDYQKQ